MRKFRKPMKRTSMRRDPVTPEVHAYVLRRDRGCVAAKVEPNHVCRDKWGYPHAPGDLARLTLEHVKDQLRIGKRADSDPAHLLALCYGTNVGVPSKELRGAFRAYLKAVEDPDDHSAHVDPCPGCPRRVAA